MLDYVPDYENNLDVFDKTNDWINSMGAEDVYKPVMLTTGVSNGLTTLDNKARVIVYAAAGSACSAESGQPSAALTALGIRGKRSFRALRLSFWKNNTVEDGEFFLSELKNVLKNY